MMQTYCSDKKLGEALESCHGSLSGELSLPAAVMRHRPKLAGEVTWHETERDEAIEIVVPLSVIEKLGKFVSAGQLAAVTSEYSAPVTHIARLVPAELCTSQMLSPEACQAFEIDEATCLTASGQEVALLSPMLAFNLGLPYFVSELTHGSELGAWLNKKNGIKILPLASTIPKPAPDMTTAQAWEPGTARPELPAASHIGLAVISTPQKQAPFNIVEYQDSMQQALQAMQGGGGQKKPDEEAMEDTELDDLAAEEHKQRDSDTMQALQDFMTKPRFVCLGDIIALPVHSTPLLGPLLTKPGPKASSQNPAEDPEKSHYIVFLRVVELTCKSRDDSNGTLTHAVLWPSKRSSFTEVMLSHCIASAFPVGTESFLLDSPPARDPPEAPSTPPLNPEGSNTAAADANEAETGTNTGEDNAENGLTTPRAGEKSSTTSRAPDASTEEQSVRLGRSTYATLNQGIEIQKGKLLCGVWRKIALQFAPNLHPSVKLGKNSTPGGALGRASVLVTGPERGGKAMEVAAAGKAMGVEVLEVDCRSLASGSPMDEAECVSHLTNIIHQARTMAPVIVLFRRLERVFPQQPNMSVVKRFSDTLVAASQSFAIPHLPELQALPPPDNPPKPEDEVPLEDLPWNVIKAGVTAYRSSGTPVEAPNAAERLRLQAVHSRYPPGVLFVAATTSKPAEVPVPLRRAFTAEIDVPAAAEEQRARTLTRMLGSTTNTASLDSDGMRSAAQSMAGFLPCDLAAMACDATLAVLREKINDGADDVVEALQGSVGQNHIDGTLESVRQRTALDLGAPKIPSVAWKDVGGLEHVKKAILETIELPLKYRGLFASGIKRRSGVLLYGPPGTGKTLIAKAVATECSINFMSIKGPELINMYVGESEKNVREVFEKARKAQPCVLFFDELDSLAPRRGNGMDSSHVSDRIVAQLLSELDGIGGGRSDVYIVGATNRPDLLDPALMRPGRLDVLLYVGVDRAPSSKLLVLQALTRKFHLKEDVDLYVLAERLPPQTTGADAYGLCADAWLIALRRRISELTASGRISKNSSSPDEAHDLDDVEVDVCMDDFGTAIGNFAPSLTLQDLDKYDALQDQYAPDRDKKGPQPGSAQAPTQSDSEGSTSSSTLKLRPKLPPRKKAAPVAVVQEEAEADEMYL